MNTKHVREDMCIMEFHFKMQPGRFCFKLHLCDIQQIRMGIVFFWGGILSYTIFPLSVHNNLTLTSASFSSSLSFLSFILFHCIINFLSASSSEPLVCCPFQTQHLIMFRHHIIYSTISQMLIILIYRRLE